MTLYLTSRPTRRGQPGSRAAYHFGGNRPDVAFYDFPAPRCHRPMRPSVAPSIFVRKVKEREMLRPGPRCYPRPELVNPDQTLNGNKLQFKKKKNKKIKENLGPLATVLRNKRICTTCVFGAPPRNETSMMAMAAVASDPNRVQASIVPTGVVQHRPSSVAGTAGDARGRMQSCLVILLYFIYLILFYPTYFLSFPSVAAGPRQPSRAWVVAGGCRWWERDHHTRRMTSMGQGGSSSTGHLGHAVGVVICAILGP